MFTFVALFKSDSSVSTFSERSQLIELDYRTIEVLLLLIEKDHDELAKIEEELQKTIMASFARKTSLKHSETAYTLFVLRESCTFCGKMVKTKGTAAVEEMTTCSGCNLAKYCSEECFAKYKAIHKQICSKSVMNKFLYITPDKV